MKSDDEKLRELELLILARVREVVSSKGRTLATVTPDTNLFDGNIPLDSLDLATLLATVTDDTRRDPFAGSMYDFRTVSELARLYLQAPPGPAC